VIVSLAVKESNWNALRKSIALRVLSKQDCLNQRERFPHLFMGKYRLD